MRWGWYESPNGDPSYLTPSSHGQLRKREQKHSQERTSKLLTPKVPANPMKSRRPKGRFYGRRQTGASSPAHKL